MNEQDQNSDASTDQYSREQLLQEFLHEESRTTIEQLRVTLQRNQVYVPTKVRAAIPR